MAFSLLRPAGLLRKTAVLGFTLALVFGLVTACDNGDKSDDNSGNNNQNSGGNPLVGTWVGTVSGNSVTVVISAENTWTMTSSAGATYSDNGSYTTSGSTASLYSTRYNLSVGTASINADGTITVSLNSSSFAPGNHTLTKQ